jgi:hypothetical protein
MLNCVWSNVLLTLLQPRRSTWHAIHPHPELNKRVHKIPSDLFKIHYNIILLATVKSSNWPLHRKDDRDEQWKQGGVAKNKVKGSKKTNYEKTIGTENWETKRT